MGNLSINVTLPNTAVQYIDEKAKQAYISRATVARQLLLEHIEEQKVIESRQRGFSIRKIADITQIRYEKVLEILRKSGLEEESDAELEQYMDQVQQKMMKKR